MTVSIHSVVERFLNLPGACVNSPAGKGTAPWTAKMNELLLTHEYLERYPDYLEFLAAYGGGGILPTVPTSDSSYTHLWIYGFGESEEGLSDDVDSNQFYAFASTEFRFREPKNVPRQSAEGMCFCHFAMDASLNRSPSVFVPVQRVYQPRWATFTEWLDEIVVNRGRLPASDLLNSGLF